MKILNILLIPAAALLCSCAPTTANLSTTSGNTAATVDNANGIVSAQSVTAPNVPSGETVGSISGTSVTLTLPANSTATASAKFTPTPASVTQTAEALIGNDLAYAESVAVQLQKVNTGLSSFVGNVTPILQASGLAPANSSQAKVLAKITSALSKSSATIGAVNSILSPSSLASLTGSNT